MLLLPDDLQACCAGFLDMSSSGRFGQANRACARLVRVRLLNAKAEAAARAAAAAAAAAEVMPRLNDAAKDFIDAHLGLYIAASSASQRKMVVHQIMEAAIVREDLAAANWTISLVNTRLFLARRLHNMVA